MFPENFVFRRDETPFSNFFTTYRNVLTMGALVIGLSIFFYTGFQFMFENFADLSRSLYALYRIQDEFESDPEHQPFFQFMFENMINQKHFPVDIPALFLFSGYMMYLM
ncbi:unnamed protein product, partial [Mesorhabditis belari]|uniref:Uncharacterized protein n=1 Tax=Mesorhabditis belari TaxID=2138241 RepID=A0AAF3F1E4_9BILA